MAWFDELDLNQGETGGVELKRGTKKRKRGI